MNILIVEDDIVFCKMLTRFFSKNGFNANDAQNAAQAKQLLISQSFDVVLLDNQLPDENGIEVLKWMQNKQLKSKIVFMSRFIDGQTSKVARELGAAQIIKKPVQPNQLLEQIKELF